MWDVSGGDGDDRLDRLLVHLETVQRIVGLGSWEADIAAERLQWSPNTFAIFGWSGSTPPTYAAFLEAVHPDDRDHLLRVHDAAIREGRPYSVVHRIVRPDGALRHIQQEAVVERDASGDAARLVGFVQDVTERMEVARTLVDTESRRRELLHRVVTASEDARVQLAGDLHDGPIQLLTVATMRLEALRMAEPDAPPWLPDVIETVRGTIDQLRDVLFALHPAATRAGLETTLTQLATTVLPDAPTTVELTGAEPTAATCRAVFGIVQEALWALREHSVAERLTIRIAVGDEGIALSVLELGSRGGGPPPNLTRASLLGVTERADALGGSCTVDAGRDGRSIRCHLPPVPEQTAGTAR